MVVVTELKLLDADASLIIVESIITSTLNVLRNFLQLCEWTLKKSAYMELLYLLPLGD